MIDIDKLIEKYGTQLTEPTLCQDADDFYKLLYGTVASAEDQPPMSLTAGLKMLFHEYLALVLRGDVPPYCFGGNVPGYIKESYREVLLEVTEDLQKSGVALKEEDGKMKIDVEEMKKMKEDHD